MAGEGSAFEAVIPPMYQGGDAAAFSLALDSFALDDGSPVSLPAPGVTAIVGANNVGKSTLLRQVLEEVERFPGNPPLPGWRLINSVQIRRGGSPADLAAWLGLHAHYVTRGTDAGFVRGGQQQVFRVENLVSDWTPGVSDKPLGYINRFFVHNAEAMQRIGMAGGAGQRNDIGEAPQHPLHYLQDDPRLLAELVELSERIFGEPLTLDRLSGQLQLRVGRPGVEAPSVEAVTQEYRAALAALPPLGGQGDGMRSLLGLLLPLVAATYPIVVVDEPEAFLHPPQAAALGRALGEIAQARQLQVLLATHDRNLLSGLLESQVAVSVVRLTREANKTRAAQLDPELLRDVWSDPVLRYSNVLDGLFHRLVVLCEGDADCRYLAAALDAAARGEPLLVPTSEVLFVPAGGKDGLPKVAKALTAVRVPVVASPDLDILDDEAKIRRMVEALGGDWSRVEADYRLATQPFRTAREPVLCRHVRDAVDAALQDHLDEAYTADRRKAVLANLRISESPWKQLKRFGEAAFSGQSAAAADRLLGTLESMGVVCVRVGELERFAPALGVSKGAAWLPAALQANEHRNVATQTHIRRVIEVGAGRVATEPTATP